MKQIAAVCWKGRDTAQKNPDPVAAHARCSGGGKYSMPAVFNNSICRYRRTGTAEAIRGIERVTRTGYRADFRRGPGVEVFTHGGADSA